MQIVFVLAVSLDRVQVSLDLFLVVLDLLVVTLSQRLQLLGLQFLEVGILVGSLDLTKLATGLTNRTARTAALQNQIHTTRIKHHVVDDNQKRK